MSISFRHSAGFGKRIEYWIVGLILKQGLDVYLPLVDDDAIDAVIKRPDGTFIALALADWAQLHGIDLFISNLGAPCKTVLSKDSIAVIGRGYWTGIFSALCMKSRKELKLGYLITTKKSRMTHSMI